MARFNIIRRGRALAQSAQMPWLTPGEDWDGGAGTGAMAPADDFTIYGSGFSEQAVAVWDTPDGTWIDAAGQFVGVGAGIGNRAMIDSVTFYMEGSTATVTAPVLYDGRIIWAVAPRSRSGLNGDVNLYAFVKPVNGRGRLIGPLRLTLSTDGAGLSRPEKYVDLDAASNGDGSQGSPWNAISSALNSAALNAGGIVHVSGTTAGEVANTGIANTRMLVFRGAAADRAVVLRPSRFRWMNNYVQWENFTIQTDNLSQIEGCTLTTGRGVFKDCWIGHSESSSGAIDKDYPAGYLSAAKFNQPFRSVEGQRFYLIDCDLRDIFGCGAWLWRNCTAILGSDSLQIASGANSYGDGVAVFGLNARQQGNGEVRCHTDLDIVVASVAAGTGNQKVITFSGTPAITTGSSAPHYLRVLQGAGAVPIGDIAFRYNEDNSSDYRWLGYAVNSATSTTITVADAANAIPTGTSIAGALCRGYLIAHGDTFQTVRQADNAPTIRNVYIQGLKSRGHSWQPILMQSGWQSATTLAASIAAGFGGISTGGITTISVVKLTTSGDVATFSDVHGIQQWGFLRLREGAQSGESRIVVEVISSTQVRLASAFSVDQSSPVSWAVRRGIKDIFVCNSVLYITDSANEVGHLEAGLIHFTMANVTIPGTAPSGAALGFSQISTNGTDLFRSVRIFDSLIKNLAPDSGSTLPAEFAGDNNWYGTGINRDTGAAADGDFWTTRGDAYAAAYNTPSAVTRTHAGKTVMIPYDMDGSPRTSVSRVGAA